jgi:hypothetical protein
MPVPVLVIRQLSWRRYSDDYVFTTDRYRFTAPGAAIELLRDRVTELNHIFIKVHSRNLLAASRKLAFNHGRIVASLVLRDDHRAQGPESIGI